MDYNSAKNIRDNALSAIEHLSDCLNIAQDNLNPEDFEVFKKAVGMSIIKVDSEVLGFIYKNFPELDHIKSD